LEVNFDIVLLMYKNYDFNRLLYLKKNKNSSRIGVTSSVPLHYKFIAGDIVFKFHNLYNSKQISYVWKIVTEYNIDVF